jgi:Tfp pilus assembly protein PilO
MSGTSVITILVLTLSIGYVFTYPSFNEISALMVEQDKYQHYLDTVADIESKKNQLVEKFNQISEDDRKSIDAVLPNSFDFVKLIAQIDAIASKNGILIDRVTSREIDPSVGGSIAEAQPAAPYRSAIIGFSFDSSHDKFNIFMTDLEKSLRILDIKSVRINPAPAGFNAYTVEFQTYWLKSQ